MLRPYKSLDSSYGEYNFFFAVFHIATLYFDFARKNSFRKGNTVRRWSLLLILLLSATALSTVFAQTQAQEGSPPIASLITVSAPDEDGIVTISGAAGAVFPTAQVAVRNLYTEQTVYVQAGITGSFAASIYGPGNTPFWISPMSNLPPTSIQMRPGSLPGGPGTIVYGQYGNVLPTRPATNIVIDGDTSDWAAYPNAQVETGEGTFYGLANNDSIYLAFDGVELPPEAPQVRVTFSLDGAQYDLSFNPTVLQAGILRRISPNPNDLGSVPVAAVQTPTSLELRLRWRGVINPNNPTLELASFDFVQSLTVDSEGNDQFLADYALNQAMLLVNEADGIARAVSNVGNDGTAFTIGGALAQGASIWNAQARVDNMEIDPGEQLVIEMNVILDVPNLDDYPVGLQVIGQLGLQMVVNEDGIPSGGTLSNNGWSNTLTPSGLPIAGLRADIPLAEIAVPQQQIVLRDGQLMFPLDFNITLPEDLPPGIYVPYFQGYAQVNNTPRFRWEDVGLFGAGGRGISRVQLHRLPIALNIDRVDEGRFLFALFYDHPSDGSRGLLPVEDQTIGGIYNDVRFNSPTYILPPGNYPVEPYLLNMMPNAYDTTAAPLLQILLGRLEGRITPPSGESRNLGNALIAQNRLSTAQQDERTLFGAHAPVDVYRVTTLNPEFTDYPFDQYGLYEIELEGSVEDVWGNRFEGGGTYNLLIAELLDLTPGVLPGTPFEVGDALNTSVHISPGMPADITMTVRVYPLGGSDPIEQIYTGSANAYGYFHPAEAPLVFDTPGEYVIDYEARYTDENGQLWAASLRSAGVIAGETSTLLARGERGLLSDGGEGRSSWFDAERYAPDASEYIVNYPYLSGDVVWVDDSDDAGLRAILRTQDTTGNYANWLLGALPDYVSADGLDMLRLSALDELPIEYFATNQSYSYLSAVRAGISARQVVIGSDSSALSFEWDMNDPYNQQLGAGANGDLPGDFTFLFGGNIVHNTEANVSDVSVYGAFAVTVSSSDELGTRVFPAFGGEAGSADGGALLTVRGEPIEMFFHPTGVLPGEVLLLGDTLAIAGQIAPTLPSRVSVTVTSPSGVARTFDGMANAVGYFYDAASDIQVDEIGVWTIDITVWHDGLTSAGQVAPPYPSGGVLGAQTAPDGVGGHFRVYVVESDVAQLDSPQAGDRVTQAGAAINFTAQIPDNWIDVHAYHVITIPGYIMSTGELQVGVRDVNFQYNPQALIRDFPMLENDGRPDGAWATDVVRLTLVITGTDIDGNFSVRARTFTVMHDRLVSIGQ
jgi:hypothetical protein